jgi:DNA-directed RNA polymerase subunit beta
MAYSFTEKKRIRNNFGSRSSILKEPDLLAIQIDSFNGFIQAGSKTKKDVGLHSVFKSVFPIAAVNGYAEIEYVDYELQEPKFNVEECKLRGVTFASILRVKLNLVLFDKNSSKKKRKVKQIIEEDVYLGQLPLMTETGTFVINGTERVVVSQLHRSPGVIFEHDKGKTHSSGKILFSSRIIPYRGSW